MRGVLLASAFAVLVHAPTAHARECQEPHRVFPADGATDVPTNASVWVLGQDQNAYVLSDGAGERLLGHSYWASPRMQRLDLGILASRHTYTVNTVRGEHVTTFTTGETVDSTPPDPPVLGDVRYEHGRLSVESVAEGSVVVWVTERRKDDRDVRAWQLFPAPGFSSAFATCNQFDVHAPGSECAELRSLDIAGNQSRIVSNCTPIVGGPHYRWSVHAHEAETSTRVKLILLIALGLVAGLGVILVRQRVAMSIAVIALLTACAHTTTATAPSTTASANATSGDSGTYPYALNFVPFGVGQFQNGDTSKGIGFAVAEGVTGATSLGIWLYLTDHYAGQYIRVEEAGRVRRMQQIEVASGVAFFGLYAWGVIDALVHYQPRIKIGTTSVVVLPTPESSGAGLTFSWAE